MSTDQNQEKSQQNENEDLNRVLTHLSMLISADTTNPPREIAAGDHVIQAIDDLLAAQGFKVGVTDHGDGHVSIHAVRGRPDVLFNVHLDTVPITSGWSVPPLEMTVRDGRVYGRGACDIKGALACLLTLAEQCRDDMAILVTSDEEGAHGCCIDQFIASGQAGAYRQVVVAEPTQSKAVHSHRGYLSMKGVFSGQSGHSSSEHALSANAIHRANHWLSCVLDRAQSAVTEDNPAGVCLNVGTISGGEKNNMIAEVCAIGISARVPPGSSSRELADELIELAGEEHADWHVSMAAPALPASGAGAQAASEYSRDFCEIHQLPLGTAVDFWTEAALFSDAGIAAIVLGPGDIAQAHTVDEWVSESQLITCLSLYRGIICHD